MALSAAARTPDKFLRLDFAKHINVVLEQLAKVINVDPEDLVFVPNATTGVNTVLRSLKFAKGEGVLHFSTIYGSCGNTVEFLVDQSDGDIFSHQLDLSYPCTDTKILSDFEHALETTKGIKVAVFDHITSLPGVKLPWLDLIKLCKKYNVLSLVDGAHGIGLTHLDLGAADPDFFISNCHKWLYSMRSTAILYTAKRSQDLIHSMPIGHGYIPKRKNEHRARGTGVTKSNYKTEFEWTATSDLSPFLAIQDALSYRHSLGGEAAIVAYITDLASTGAAAIAEILGTEVMDVTTPIGMMNVRLPIDAKRDEQVMAPRARGDWFFRVCTDEFNTTFSPFVHNGSWWGRFSAQIYLEVEDFEYTGRVIKKLCERIQREHEHTTKQTTSDGDGSSVTKLMDNFGRQGLEDTVV
ncbi:protein of unknown function [Taphrina deformans PYCC 5710]|uniref:Aminotransferase class V domain-containing protein n=1 Tax=Taphrina deformans (strain PYCC 5710 / ATCC 11124 / CBS 356.35 / IMI 108563 / JCM 9778 / NBRC 8474) TaxID=1097556 RepID=R4XFY9_TAPDE|nr:protein of unknown function [Taphrina deformans PYCC 5710]|eukprot:CCG84796.1 protein of unknown function [Taphrina deformans PYCC 5710]